jgi:hypothetical protein
VVSLPLMALHSSTGFSPSLPPGLWISSHFMRPIRLSLAIAAAPFFDRALSSIMQLTGIRNKVAAFAIMLVGIALGTMSSLVLAIFLCGGFPLTS